MIRKMAFLIFSLIFIPVSIYSQSVLRFGVFPAHDLKTMIRLFSPVALRVEQSTGIPVVLVSAPSRSKFNERTLKGSYDILWTCLACYLVAHKKTGIYAIARGTPPFKGVVLVQRKSGIKSIEDLKGKKIAAVSPYSIAGYLFLREKLQQAGIFDKDVEVKFFDLPESIPFKVLGGNYDAGVFSEDTYIQSPLFDSVRGKLRILAESEPIPQFPFAVKKGLNRDIVERIRQGLVSITPRNRGDSEILKTLGYTGIELTNDGKYDSFRQMFERFRSK